ncbi:ornithine cyclodeaminase family protein [Pseudoalteromonas tunicata]|jgi:1-pyrroline-2-carboxylate reductase [NAD(P)H]|uniref:Ornithine cyclodeaminase n=1 Tax=Pseudoalteromonas tunicata D2 TaxID=87626 RepID=A4C7R1_9GAMM|nr:ornithine cyclodeaminase family protein [Pseudoalteromonas tunicata]ATC93132.1 ornithine cyclodeaminase [Pseudoalteromonas tunicata]AXT32204.1 ornithine cyclodeaminase family protein [Pseudoalteromonas tunicata]EAR28626.1 ornithine cyclodeaminase [Pseudoalteromonas tunicata D2]MDP5212688.1 ornithine cyclodeaminase family protein [Pseudoalteromonas tunicata]
MLVIDKTQVEQAFDFPSLIDALDRGFAGHFSMPKRQVFELLPGDAAHNAFAVLPAWNDDVIGVKSFTYFPQNAAQGYESLYSKIMLFDRKHGVPLALVDGTSVTYWRTAAVSALASRYLSRENSKSLLFFGSGNLASFMIKAHLSVRALTKVVIAARNHEKAQVLIEQLQPQYPEVEFTLCQQLQSAVAAADIISCATGSKTPLFDGAWLKAGVHIDLIGNHHSEYRECDTATVLKSSVYLDSIANVMNEAGELLIPIAAGVITEAHIKAELASLCANKEYARQSDSEITLFKSVGTALSDLVAAHSVYKKVINQL